MRLEDFVKRGAAVAGLCRAFASGAPPHATLLVGPAGVGKRTLASVCCQSLFCVEVVGKPCGLCPPCRRYLSGSHPDAWRIPEKKSIGVEEIRALIAALAEAPYEGGWRTVLIECAGAMTPQAQNCLLKTLEEPPPRTAFLLTAGSASQVLATVQSRCRVVPLPPCTEEEVAGFLQSRGVEADRARQVAALANGSLGDALRLQADEAFWTLREKIRQAMAGLSAKAQVPETLAALQEYKGDALRVCGVLEGGLRDAMAAAAKGESRPAADGWDRALYAMDARRLAALLAAVLQMRRMLASNVSWQAALEQFLFQYAEEGNTWQS
ncbi:MAG TPA: DNA polymerase III subunit delta' [Candidatus Avichristensenella intestinipullorum]|uniref:DNA polymerase III subunit delta n=1 Tax=Candidatus Avichristensenella intestinipullorum TaxID=2840693 RepID=A0A9D0YVX0_9FIRM|nr:DNA polymerase III subunit delta' [Candidatus Avichristensenella intestinipullorum]